MAASSEADLAARLIERLLADPAFRARFRRDPAGACREAGLDELAQEMSRRRRQGDDDAGHPRVQVQPGGRDDGRRHGGRGDLPVHREPAAAPRGDPGPARRRALARGPAGDPGRAQEAAGGGGAAPRRRGRARGRRRRTRRRCRPRLRRPLRRRRPRPTRRPPRRPPRPRRPTRSRRPPPPEEAKPDKAEADRRRRRRRRSPRRTRPEAASKAAQEEAAAALDERATGLPGVLRPADRRGRERAARSARRERAARSAGRECAPRGAGRERPSHRSAARHGSTRRRAGSRGRRGARGQAGRDQPGAVRRRGGRARVAHRTRSRWRCSTTRTSCSTTSAIADIKAGRIDPRVVAVLTKLSQEHKINVSCMCSDHSKMTAGGSISNHFYGRGLDIAAIDGETVSPGSTLAREVASELSSLDPNYPPERDRLARGRSPARATSPTPRTRTTCTSASRSRSPRTGSRPRTSPPRGRRRRAARPPWLRSPARRRWHPPRSRAPRWPALAAVAAVAPVEAAAAAAEGVAAVPEGGHRRGRRGRVEEEARATRSCS